MNGRSWGAVQLEQCNMPEAMARFYVPKKMSHKDVGDDMFQSKLQPRSKSCVPFSKSSYIAPPKARSQKVYGKLPDFHGSSSPTVRRTQVTVAPYKESEVVPVGHSTHGDTRTVQKGRRAGQLSSVLTEAPHLHIRLGDGSPMYDSRIEARTAVARRREYEAAAAEASGREKARLDQEQMTLQADNAGYNTFSNDAGRFTRALHPMHAEAASWGAAAQSESQGTHQAPRYSQIARQLPQGATITHKDPSAHQIVRPPRPQSLRRQRACGTWPHRKS